MSLTVEKWDVSILAHNGTRNQPDFYINEKSQTVSYPFRTLRYWFVANFLKDEINHKDALSGCEVGVEKGQMLSFFKGCFKDQKDNPVGKSIEKWDAVSIDIDEERLRQIGYTGFLSIDLNSPSYSLTQQYDVIIMLHVLEHLPDAGGCGGQIVAIPEKRRDIGGRNAFMS